MTQATSLGTARAPYQTTATATLNDSTFSTWTQQNGNACSVVNDEINCTWGGSGDQDDLMYVQLPSAVGDKYTMKCQHQYIMTGNPWPNSGSETAFFCGLADSASLATSGSNQYISLYGSGVVSATEKVSGSAPLNIAHIQGSGVPNQWNWSMIEVDNTQSPPYIKVSQADDVDFTTNVSSCVGQGSQANAGCGNASWYAGSTTGLDHVTFGLYPGMAGMYTEILANQVIIYDGVNADGISSTTIPTYHIGTQPDGATNPLAVIDELHIHSAPAETVVAKSHDRGDAEFNLVDTVPFSTEGATITYSDTSVTPGDAPIYQIYSFNLAGETELQTLIQGLSLIHI